MADFTQKQTVEQFVREALTLSEGAVGKAYRLSFAGTGNSGASYGLFQNDIATNHDALVIFQDSPTDTTDQSGFTDSQISQFVDLAANPGRFQIQSATRG